MAFACLVHRACRRRRPRAWQLAGAGRRLPQPTRTSTSGHDDWRPRQAPLTHHLDLPHHVDKLRCTELSPGVTFEWGDPVTMQLRRRGKLMWERPPQHVLLVKKWQDEQATDKLVDVARWLTAQGVAVLVEESVAEEEKVARTAARAWTPAQTTTHPDLAVVLGGDGTLLHLAHLFALSPPPPVISFNMGTLGFLTPFNVAHYKSILKRLLSSNEEDVWCTLRTRIRCEVYDHVVQDSTGASKRILQGAPAYVFNECTIKPEDDGVCKLDTIVDNHHVTTVRGDGLLISTPSGSTAYNLSAGGALVAPSVPCTLLTPIAPHSLSSRPFIVPESSRIEVRVPMDSRHECRISFDGQDWGPLRRGQSVQLRTSRWPLPLISLEQYDSDWFRSLSKKLHWNVPVADLVR